MKIQITRRDDKAFDLRRGQDLLVQSVTQLLLGVDDRVLLFHTPHRFDVFFSTDVSFEEFRSRIVSIIPDAIITVL